MNRHTARALVQDAYYQVVDNMVFRLLVILVICLVAPTFLIAFRPDKISVLFGMWTYSYNEVGWMLGHFNPNAPDANVRVIQKVQSFFVQGLPSNFGVMLSLAATAFFVPRMLEKGEADTLFSKPVSRFVLLFTRYLSGVFFVGALALILVVGMQLGLLLRSGYSDPGFLWSALTLTYVFALIHAFSVMVGVFTRSSVAALLLSVLLFAFNGCIQSGWSGKEYLVERQRLQDEAHENEPRSAREMDLSGAGMQFLFRCLDVLHFPLPKTYDADILTNKLRTVVAGDRYVLSDPAGKLLIQGDPKDLTRSDAAREKDLSQSPAVWTAEENGRVVAKVTVGRHDRRVERKSGESTRTVRTSTNAAANDLIKTLEARTDIEGKPTRRRSLDEGPVRDGVSWKERGPAGLVSRERVFLAIDDWMFDVDLEADPAWLEFEQNSGTPTQHSRMMSQFVEGLKPQRDSATDLNAEEWYEKRIGWDAPLKYNAFFSLGSSIAFAALMLLLARWRLSRIDF